MSAMFWSKCCISFSLCYVKLLQAQTVLTVSGFWNFNVSVLVTTEPAVPQNSLSLVAWQCVS